MGTRRQTSKVESPAEMAEEVLLCRGDNHPWQWLRDFDITKNRSGYVVGEFKRAHVCPRCGTDRTQTIDAATFTVVKAVTRYPDGYLSKAGRVYRADVRREQLVRAGYKVKGIKR